MKHIELVRELEQITSYEWVGSLGYNDTPYLRRGHNNIGKAPVKTEVGFADGRPGYVQEAGDILWFLQNAQVGDVLVIPQYWGCNRDADIIHTFTNNGWSEAEYIDYRS